MVDEFKTRIQVYKKKDGIITEHKIEKPSVINCPRCNLVNSYEKKYCSNCSYPLVPSAFDKIKSAEDFKLSLRGKIQ